MGYRFNFVKPDDPYYPNWVEKRRRARIFWLCSLAWLPVTFLSVLFIWWGFDTEVQWGLLGAIPTTIVYVGVRFYTLEWPCPRCGRPFYYVPWFFFPFADNCLHCGLPEYAPRDDSVDLLMSTAIT